MIILKIGLAVGLFAGMCLMNDANALRCNGQIIDEGSSYHEVMKNCDSEFEYEVNNQNADIKKVYIEQGGATNEVIIIDGEVKEINWSR